MKGRTGTLAILAIVLTVSMMAFPGAASADGQFGEASGAGFSLPQFGLEDLVRAPDDPFFVPAPISLIGEDVLSCRNAGRFGEVCRVDQVPGTAAGRCCPFPEAQAVVLLGDPEPEEPVERLIVHEEVVREIEHERFVARLQSQIREGLLQDEPGFFEPQAAFDPLGAFSPPGSFAPPGAFPPPGAINPSGTGFFIP